VKWDLDLWYEMWERAGSQGLDTWYPIAGEPSEGEPGAVRGPGLDGLDGVGGSPSSAAGGGREGE
jgi:hypothetical protein